MAQRRRDGARDWFFTLVGSGVLVAYVLTSDKPSLPVIIGIGSFAGAPGISALADLVLGMVRRKNGNGS